VSTWHDRLEQARKIAQERAREATARARDAADKAAPVVKQQAERGKALVDGKLAERKEAAQRRSRWYLTETGSVHTAGYPDRETMRLGIEAAAEHGWRVETVAQVPERRIPGVGLTGAIAKQAFKRVVQSDSYLVTFRATAAEASSAPVDKRPPTPPPAAAD
jgi:DNA gyrase/topoisomerase IV subunit B